MFHRKPKTHDYIPVSQVEKSRDVQLVEEQISQSLQKDESVADFHERLSLNNKKDADDLLMEILANWREKISKKYSVEIWQTEDPRKRYLYDTYLRDIISSHLRPFYVKLEIYNRRETYSLILKHSEQYPDPPKY